MITIDQLSFAYGGHGFQLDVPALTIADGEKLALIGPSGCGKTTLAHLIAGILVPHAGTITVRDTVINHIDDAARRRFRLTHIGFVFQQFALLDYITCYDNITLPNYIGFDAAGPRAGAGVVQKLADGLGIGDKLNRLPGTLSHGERQRVAIARALLYAPPLVIADEPTGNLDPENARAIMTLIHAHVDAAKCTLLMVTHNHDLLDGFDRVIDVTRLRAP